MMVTICNIFSETIPTLETTPYLGGGAVLPRVGYISPPQLGPISKAVEVIATVISCYIQYVTPTAAPSIVGMGKVP